MYVLNRFENRGVGGGEQGLIVGAALVGGKKVNILENRCYALLSSRREFYNFVTM